MKAMRVSGFVFLVLSAGYLLWIHGTNSTFITLPGFISLPPAVVVAAALALGWLVAWLPAQLTLWRKERELNRLNKRLYDLEQHVPSYDRVSYDSDEADQDGPVIPDRVSNAPEPPDTKAS